MVLGLFNLSEFDAEMDRDAWSSRLWKPNTLLKFEIVNIYTKEMWCRRRKTDIFEESRGIVVVSSILSNIVIYGNFTFILTYFNMPTMAYLTKAPCPKIFLAVWTDPTFLFANRSL